MSTFEKICIIGSLASIGIGSVYFIAKASLKSENSKNVIIETRKKILQNPNVRILYSTMSFFYLQGYKENDLSSLFLLYDILNVSTPNIIALQLSEKEFNEKYTSVINHPHFGEVMKKVNHHLKLKSDEILKMKEIELKSLENLYCIDYCRTKKCKILYGDISHDELSNLYEGKLQVNELNKKTKEENPDLYKDLVAKEIKSQEEIYKEVYYEERENFYVDSIMNSIAPKMKIIPENPYKTIVGISSPENISGIATKWKNKFKSVYGHQILEEEGKLEKS